MPLAPGGKIPEDLRTESVFLNPETQELLVVTDRAGAIANPIAFQLHNQAIPSVISKITIVPSGGYLYEYVIGSSTRSRGPMEKWSLLIAAEDPLFSCELPPAWRVETENTLMVERAASKHAPLRYVHFVAGAGAEIGPGTAKNGLRVRSSNLPGYVTAFARSKVDRPFSAQAVLNLPEAARAKLSVATSPEWDSQLRLVIGPRFLPGTDTIAIAASFHYAIQYFLNQKELSPDSGFVKDALASLTAYIEGSTGGPFGASRLSFAASAKTPLEEEMAEAMAVSLNSGR
ncbi:MAG: hypothetical protein LAP87_26245 [Acidobacteriia bacterium]|nr:hypothetical protein [Terriglobia bacterium]